MASSLLLLVSKCFSLCCLLMVVLFSFPATCDDMLLPIVLNANSSARTDPAEVEAVYEVMAATGNSWARQVPDVCKGRWHGIECTLDPNTNLLHVVSLSFGVLSEDTAFPACSSDSVISPSIAKLAFLRRLFFYKCCNGNPQTIPSEIGKLGASLESLVLRENGHLGAIPVELANLTRLHTLDLHGNHLNSSIPATLGNLSLIQRLDLSSNELTGNIPWTFSGLKGIKILDLSNNHLQGELPDALSNLGHLKKLDLSNNRLIGSIPASFGYLQSILFMDLSKNHLTGGIPTSFGRLTTLQDLILTETNLSLPIPESLGNVTSLQVLVLSTSETVGRIPKALGKLTWLRVLQLEKNRLTGPLPVEIIHLPRLTELNVAANSLSGPVPFSKEFVNRLGRRLRLMNNSGLCYRFHKHNEMLGIERCPDLDDYKDPAQISLPAIIIPSEPYTRSSSSSLGAQRSIASMGAAAASFMLLNHLESYSEVATYRSVAIASPTSLAVILGF